MKTRRLGRLAACLCLVLAACGGNPSEKADPSDLPTVDFKSFDTPERVGTGLIDGTTLDGSAIYIEEPDPGFPEPGCEGQPEPVMFVQPLGEGERTPAGGAKPPLHGSLIRGGSGDRVAVVSGCESFFTGLFVAAESEDGTLSGLKSVTPAVPEGFLLNPSTVSWSRNGKVLLAAIQDVDAPDGDPAQIVAIDPASGKVTKLFDAEQGTGVFGVGQMQNGYYVVATNLVVSFRNAKGTVQAGFQGQGFDISPDRRRLVVFGRNLRLAAQGDTKAAKIVPEKEGLEISSARFSPDGRAVVFERYALDTGQVEVNVVTPAGKELTNIVTGSQYGRSFFTGDGKALVFNMFGGETDLTTRAYVARFD